MSIFERFADRPWARPPQYTSEADPSHQEAQPGQKQATPQPARIPSELGDGRPRGGITDNTPMQYRRGDPNAVIDVDDHDELDVPEEYAPPPKVEPAMAAHPAYEEMARGKAVARAVQERISTPKPDPRQPHPGSGTAPHRIGFKILGVQDGQVHVGATAPVFAATAEELEAQAQAFLAWASMLRALK